LKCPFPFREKGTIFPEFMVLFSNFSNLQDLFYINLQDLFYIDF